MAKQKKSNGGVSVKRATTKRAQAAKAAAKNQGIVVPRIEQHLLQHPPFDDRIGDKRTHVSALAKKYFCVRAEFWRTTDVSPTDAGEVHTPHTLRIWSFGDRVHETYQDHLWDAGDLYGTYRCLRCQFHLWQKHGDRMWDYYEEFTWYANAPKECFRCRAPRWLLKYDEVTIDDESLNVVGHADLLTSNALGEIKTLSTGSVRILAPNVYNQFLREGWSLQQLWGHIRRPFPEHLRQGFMYGWLKKMRTVTFIYECKWMQATKEFVCQVNEDLIEGMIDNLEELQKRRENGKTPRRPEWAEEGRRGCKECAYRTKCWSTSEAELTQQQSWNQEDQAKPRKKLVFSTS